MTRRLQILSDLHLEVSHMPEPRLAPGVDAVVVAGDVVPGAERGLAWLRRCFGPDVPIVMVAGNHEFYGRDVDEEVAAARRLAPRHGITFLENDCATVAGLRFAGATLWTDYELYGDAREAMRRASRLMNDHGRITAFPPEAALARHRVSRSFLERTPCDVVVTHHLPSAGSVHPKHAGDLLTPAFASDLDDLVERTGARLWVHGHTHSSCDHRIGSVRVLCNPKGYGAENPDYDPRHTVDLADGPAASDPP